MLGAGRRPRPGNNIACNTTERITVYVKPGKPRKFSASVVAANEMPQAIKRDLAQQVWCMIPARSKDHRAPFPERLPARLIRLFAMMRSTNTAVTSSANDAFPGEIVLDPFCGTGTTCVAAKRMGLRWIGIDRVPNYADLARVSVGQAPVDGWPDLRVGSLKWPTKVEEAEAEKADVSDAASHRHRLGATTTKVEDVSHRHRLGSTVTAVREAGEKKHKHGTYGRRRWARQTDGA